MEIPKIKEYNKKLRLKFTAAFPDWSIKLLSFFFNSQITNGAITPPNGKTYPKKADKCKKNAVLYSFLFDII